MIFMASGYKHAFLKPIFVKVLTLEQKSNIPK